MSLHRFFLIDINGGVVWDSGLIEGERVPVPTPLPAFPIPSGGNPAPNPSPTPTPTPTPGPPGQYVASGVWLYANERWNLKDMAAGETRETEFTVQSGYVGGLELALSIPGSTHIYVDDVEYTGPLASFPEGHHKLRAYATVPCSGSVDVQHGPPLFF